MTESFSYLDCEFKLQYVRYSVLSKPDRWKTSCRPTSPQSALSKPEMSSGVNKKKIECRMLDVKSQVVLKTALVCETSDSAVGKATYRMSQSHADETHRGQGRAHWHSTKLPERKRLTKSGRGGITTTNVTTLCLTRPRPRTCACTHTYHPYHLIPYLESNILCQLALVFGNRNSDRDDPSCAEEGEVRRWCARRSCGLRNGNAR